ncbi:ABC transporter permease [Actinoplanes sp. RD1]|uniref:ABC transporter permease n=1 Tax=Actinoplanes sp. RD1 TaxID=3064538 RepID=UPI0027425834|nr:ABC transporter permease [Actinoplanes sp. RD1]
MTLAWSMVRHRFAAFAGTCVAVALGVALIAGAVTLWASSRPEAPERYDAAAVIVRSPAVGKGSDGYTDYRSWTTGEADALAAGLAQLPGVTSAVPDPTFYVQRAGKHAQQAGKDAKQGEKDAGQGDRTAGQSGETTGQSGETTGQSGESAGQGGEGAGQGGKDARQGGEEDTKGHSWSSAALGGYRLTAGRAPARTKEVVSHQPPGTRIDVLTARGPETWIVTGTTDGPGLYVADRDARVRAGGVRVIGLTGRPDVAQVRAFLAPAGDDVRGEVVEGRDRATLESEEITRIRWIGAQLIIAVVVLGAFVAVFVIASTCALSAAQRQRELGLLRAVGATPGQVRRLMYAETTVVAALGGLLGVPAGALLAPLLARPMVAAGLEPAGFAVTVQPLVLAGSFGLGIVVALLGAAAAARRSSRVPALEALREAAAERRAMTWPRGVAGALTGLAGAALTVALPALPLTTQTTAALGAAMLLLVAAALLAPVVIVPLVRVLTRPWQRTATGMLVREGALTGVRRVASTAAPVLLTVGFTVLLTGSIATISESTGLDETAKLPVSHVAAPDGTPGISEAVAARQPGAAPLPSEVVLTLDGRTAAYQATGETGVTGAVLSDRIGHRPASVDVTFADGETVRLRVTGTHDGPAELVTLPRAQVREHDPNALTDHILLTGPAVPGPGMKVLSSHDYVRELIEEEDGIVRVFLLVLITLTAGWTALAVANTLLMATAARRDEFRALRLAGGGTSHALGVAGAEALLAVLVGTVLGGGVALAALLGMRRAVEAEVGQSVALQVPWGQAATVVLICAMIAVAAAGIPILRGRTA